MINRIIRSIIVGCAMGMATTPLALAKDGSSDGDLQAGKRPPNIVIILADDIGHNDVSHNGNHLVSTPNVDRLAREGANFLTAYAGDAICAPSRAALLTGRRPQRYGFEYLPYIPGFAAASRKPGDTLDMELHESKPPPPELNGLAPSEITLANMLRTAGYRTGIFGKWHLGRAPNLNPVNRGFDEFVGLLDEGMLHARTDDPDVVAARLPWSGHDARNWKHAIYRVQRGLGPQYEPQGYLGDYITGEAIDFIDRNSEKPFFVYLPLTEPHIPLQAPKRFYDRLSHIRDERTRVYYAMIENLDFNVGRIMAALKERGLDENTLIIFTSDNGGAPFTRIPYMNLPFRGSKITYFEGGLNVPMFMRWPDHIAPGTVVTGIASQLDVVPTVMRAARRSLPSDRAFDGRDLIPYALGESSVPLDDRVLVWRKDGYRAMRAGPFKLQLLGDQTWLYNLDNDPTERINLAEAMPEKVAELTRLLKQQEREFVAPAWPSQGAGWIDVDGVPPEGVEAGTRVLWTN